MEIKIEGILALDQPEDFDRAHVEVELRDTSLADMPRSVVASTHRFISGSAVRTIKFSLKANVEQDRDYTLGAEVRRGAKLAPHDLLSVVSRQWRAGEPNPVLIEVKSIF